MLHTPIRCDMGIRFDQISTTSLTLLIQLLRLRLLTQLRANHFYCTDTRFLTTAKENALGSCPEQGRELHSKVQ